jgi:predicted DNA-binding ribbon-helix-helix protein
MAPRSPRDESGHAASLAVLDGWDATAAQRPRKRSLAIAGHRTSISLEEPFWEGLRHIALDKGMSVAALVAAVDAVRGEASLSSALRLFVFSRMADAMMAEPRRARK